MPGTTPTAARPRRRRPRSATALETEQDEPATVGIRLVLSWGVVSLMLMYGVYETVVTALNLI